MALGKAKASGSAVMENCFKGSIIMIGEMVLEYTNGPTVMYIKDILLTIYAKEGVKWAGLMAIFMKDNGGKVKHMVRDLSNSLITIKAIKNNLV